MKINLSRKELVFLAAALKKINLHGLEYDSDIKQVKNLSISEEDFINVKSSLCKKKYINIINENKIDIDENIQYTLNIWADSKYTITILESNKIFNIKKFIYIYGKYMVTMEKVWGDYYLELIKEEDEIKEKLVSLFSLKDNVNEEVFNISISERTLEEIIKQHKANDIEKLKKSFNRLGLSYEEGEKVIQNINKDESNYKKFIVQNNHNKNKSIIKLTCDDGENYMFKRVDKVLYRKIVLVKHNKEEIIKSILV